MAAITPRNQALTDQILATLADEGSLPISTMAVFRKLNAGQPEPTLGDVIHLAQEGSPVLPLRVGYGDVWRILSRLAKCGEVEKITVPGMRCRYWRRTTGDDGRSW